MTTKLSFVFVFLMAAALFWLGIMFALTISDYWTRTWMLPLGS